MNTPSRTEQTKAEQAALERTKAAEARRQAALEHIKALRSSMSNTGKGAAEEPEPEPDPAPSATAAAAATAAYDPREYQPPHPADRGGKPSKKKGDGATAKAKGDGEGEGGESGAKGDGTHRCGNCDEPDAKRKCKGCGVEYYCNRECQTVGLGRR